MLQYLYLFLMALNTDEKKNGIPQKKEFRFYVYLLMLQQR